MGKHAVFLDRDGVIIANRDDYIKSWDEAIFLPGALEAMQRLADSDLAVVLVTNQSAVGRGIITLEQAYAINELLIAEIEARGGRVDACYLCPHRPDQSCDCRKPAAGMLLRAADEFGLELPGSFLVGDAATDIQAAQAAGVTGILVQTGRGAEQALALSKENLSCVPLRDLSAAVNYILSEQEGPAPMHVNQALPVTRQL